MSKPKKIDKVEDHIFDDREPEEVVYNVSITAVSTEEGVSNNRGDTWEGEELFTITRKEITEYELQLLAKNIDKMGKAILIPSACYESK